MLDILHKLKIFFCDDDVEKIYVRDSTVIRNNEIHRMYNEILYELGDLATVVSRNYVYGKKDGIKYPSYQQDNKPY